jgi:O-antigen/teichoic acid export membrane protein
VRERRDENLGRLASAEALRRNGESILRGLLAKLRSDSSFAAMFRVVIMRAAALGTTVLTGLLTAAVLGPSGRGEQAAMILAPQFLAGVSSLGLHAALIYTMKTDPDRAWDYLGANLIMTAASATVAAAIGWSVLPWWLSEYPADVVGVARALVWITPMLAMSWCFTAAAEVRGLFGFANTMANLQSLLVLVLLLLFIAMHWLTPIRSACIYMFASVPVFVGMVVRLAQEGTPVPTLRLKVIRPLLHYGLRFYGTDLLGTLHGYLDQIVILPFLSPAQIGVYVVASSLARTLRVLADAVSSVLFPSMSGKSTPAILAMVFKTLRVTAAINFALALALGVSARFLLHTIYGDRFSSGAVALQILLAATLFQNTAGILYQALNAAGRPEMVTLIEVVGTSSSFGLMICLVPHFGIVGAASAILLASILRLAVTLISLPRILPADFRPLVLGRIPAPADSGPALD